MDPISSFSISSTHIAFVAMPSYLNPAWHSRQDVYLLPLELSSKTKKPSDHTLHAHGEVSSLAFSPDGKKLAWLETEEDTQLYDNAKLVVLDISKTGPTTRWTRDWDRNPEAISVSCLGAL